MAHRRDGGFELTELGRQTLFIKQCIDGLRALANGESGVSKPVPATFLGKKGHIEIDEASGSNESDRARGRMFG